MSWTSFFGRGSDDLPATIEPLKRGKDVNLEIFIDGSITKIYNEASARSRDQRQIKEACKKLLDVLRSEDANTTFKLSMPLGEKEVEEVMTPLRLACASKIPRLQEPALGCVHKLVAHSYLQGESSSSGKLDEKTMVAQVVNMVYRCGENNSEAVQLSVIRALLTIVTADHFVLHGDCLMQAVRTVFNVAVGSDSIEMQRTAKNALLQMLNTVLKRVTTPLHFRTFSLSQSSFSPASSRPLTPAQHDITHLTGSNGSLVAMMEAVAQQAVAQQAASQVLQGENEVCTFDHVTTSERVSKDAAVEKSEDTKEPLAEGKDIPSREAESQAADGTADTWTLVTSGRSSGDAQESLEGQPEASGSDAISGDADPPASGVEPDGNQKVNGVSHTVTASQGTPAGSQHVHSAEMRAATLASLAEQVDIRGLEKALEKDAPPMLDPTISPQPKPDTSAGSEAKEAGRRSLMRDRLPKWKHLTVLERDVLLVLTAICKMAAREAAGSTTETFLLKGKLLALDLLIKVLSNPHHHWEPVRTDFCDQLRQPLCLALLRNCTSTHTEVFAMSCRLLTLVMHQQKLRAGLKAELGALFPLLLLRPVEAERPEFHQLTAALEALQVLCSDPQLLVDLFVNFDCSLQAANLYERTMKALCRIIKSLEPSQQLPMANVSTCKDAALKALQAAISSLDAWAGPLKDATSAAVVAAQDPVENSEGGAQAPPLVPAAAVSLANPGEVERFGAAKEKKDSLQAAIATFNRKPLKGVQLLITSGLIADDVFSIAKFLRENAATLDKTMIGEYLGHHEEKEIGVMHAYIDLDRYEGLTIDNGLRKLLGAFRLPGESQKIDRIMEKFAERYCKDNPNVFRTAGDAYILSFAIIMLNTDAHNPMAEQRLTCEDFINMNQSQDEDGSYHPILPAEEIEGIFKRITTNEIQTHDDRMAHKQPSKQTASIMKLAAALGITQVMLPFRGGVVWDKQHGVDVERKWLLEKTRELVAKGSAAGVMWHSASHSEHARPMMQVSGEVLMKAFVSAVHQAQDMQTANDVLNGFAMGVRLTGILGLYNLCETMTSALAAETGVSDPAPQGSLREQKQVAALHALLSIASGFEGGLLGTSWLIILRVLSQLNRLQAQLLVTPDGQLAIDSGSYRGRSLLEAARQNRLHEQGGVMRMMSTAARRSGNESEDEAQIDADAADDIAAEEPPNQPASSPMDVSVEDGAGHGIVSWSIKAGEDIIYAVYLRSVSLDGDAVIAFFRALCAVSQEEIQVSGKPRLFSLKKLVECAHVNMGRIRLVLSRIWSVVAPHLVSAACHPDIALAKYAVECMRQLITKLLIRAELANFTYQDEALRPFVSVLRHCDGPEIREFAARSISTAISAHPRGLGSGWRSLLQALTIAAADENARVVAQALESLQPVVAALYRHTGGGHEYFKECITAVMAAVNNVKHEELSIKALHSMRTVALRLAAAREGNHFRAASVSDTGLLSTEEAFPRTLSTPETSTSNGVCGSWSPKSYRLSSENAEINSPSARDSSTARHCSIYDREWTKLLGGLARIARMEPRGHVADAAGAVLFDVMTDHSAQFDNKTWQIVFSISVHPLFDVPANTRHMARSSSSGNEESTSAAPGHDRAHLSHEGLDRLERQSRSLMRQLWDLLARQYTVRGAAVLRQCLHLCVSYIMYSQQNIAMLGVVQLKHLVDRLGTAVDPLGWREIVNSLSLASSTDHLHNELDLSTCGVSDAEAKSIAEKLRCRCALVVSMQRMIGEVHARWQLFMPGEVQLQMMSILKDSVDRALQFNQDNIKRSNTLMLLSARYRPPSKNTKFQLTHSGDLGHLTLAGGRQSTTSHSHDSEEASPADGVTVADTEASVIERMGNVSSSGEQDVDFGFEKVERPGYAPVAQDLFVPDLLRPALLRQEVEGGLLLLTSLLSTMELRRKKMASEGAEGESAMVFHKAQQQLLMVCRRLISVATDDVLDHETNAGSLGTVGDTSWDTAIRAPLTVSALRAYLSVEVGAMKAEVKDVFNDLTILMRSPDFTVRREVEAVFDGRIFEILTESSLPS